MIKKVLRDWPVLDISINILFISIVSSVWSYKVDSHYMEYVKLNVRIFKWQFNVVLYKYLHINYQHKYE